MAWPPVIARIRDLDKPVVPAGPPASPVAEQRIPAKPLPGKTSTQRRRNQNVSSRLIALAGIIIFLVAIVPFMHLRDSKTTTKPDGAAALPNPAAPKSDSATPFLGGAAANADPAGKTSSRPSLASPVSLTNTAKSAAAATPSASPLMPSPDKKAAATDLFAGPYPTMGTRPGAATSVEQIATRPGVRAPADHNVEIIGEYVPLPGPIPAKAEPAAAGTLRTSPEMSNNSPATSPTGPGIPPAFPNQPMLSCGGVPSGMMNSPQPYPTLPSPYPARPAANDPGNAYRGGYQEADRRNDYAGSYQFSPNYRLNPPANGEQPPPVGPVTPANESLPRRGQFPPAYGQPQPPYNQLPPPYGQTQPSPGRAGATSLQAPVQYNPNQPAARVYPANQPVSPAPSAGPAAGSWQGGGYPAAPVIGGNPNAVPAGTVNPAVGARDGYSIPPMSDYPPTRYQESYR